VEVREHEVGVVQIDVRSARREVIARYYHLDERAWNFLFYYPRWQVMFLNRHFRTAWHLFRADPDTRERARYELIRRDLLAWVTKG
jgi:hypothetical protein